MKIQKGKVIVDNNLSYETPDDVFNYFDRLFHFTVDAASDDTNFKVDYHWTEKENGLIQDWSKHRVWCNPPYGREMGKWVRKAYQESLRGAFVVMLIPSKTDTSYFHEYILKKAKIIFIRGRLKFKGKKGKLEPAIFPSMIVIWGLKKEVNNEQSVDDKK